jgi:hypothetical protein
MTGPRGWVYTTMRDAKRFIGQNVRVVEPGGHELEGRLVEVRPDALVFERTLQSGTVSILVRNHDIDSLQAWHP